MSAPEHMESVGYFMCGFVHGQSLDFQGFSQRNRMESKYTNRLQLSID
jgi:hypothetical protein